VPLDEEHEAPYPLQGSLQDDKIHNCVHVLLSSHRPDGRHRNFGRHEQGHPYYPFGKASHVIAAAVFDILFQSLLQVVFSSKLINGFVRVGHPSPRSGLP
jgi:hypothetical protein